MAKGVAAPAPERFNQFFSRTDTGCWEWTGGLFKHFPYGKFNAGNQRTVYAHRFSYELHKGEIPEGMQVLHECDNPRCVRPDHLFLGTQLDNMRDMIAKGRNDNGGWQSGSRRS